MQQSFKTRLHAQAAAFLVLPVYLALALLKLFSQFSQLCGIVEDVGDDLFLLGCGIVAGLGLLRLGRPDASVLDATAQLVDGQKGAWLTGGNRVKIGSVRVVVGKGRRKEREAVAGIAPGPRDEVTGLPAGGGPGPPPT